MERQRLLIVEDQEAIASQLRWALSDEYEVAVAGTARMALELAEGFGPDLITLDLGIPPEPRGTGEGLRVLRDLIQHERRLKIVVITGSQEKEAALEAIHLGAYDYLTKPMDLDQLRVVLRRAGYVQRLERENDARAESLEASSGFGPILGISEPMRALFHQIERIAPSNTTVLVRGESGAGKELVAQAIHNRSRRAKGPFVAINCAAIPHDLLEAELFGHEKGAYTGAHIRRRGKIEFADRGTVFLDEVGELDLALQAKLLRFLQDHRVERIGAREAITVDVRVVSATNADLERRMGDGRFREDLYHRLTVVSLHVPPLRDRGEDIVLLANALLRRFSREGGERRPQGFTPEAIEAMKSYGWPGNVRELESKIQRSVLVASGSFITPPDLGLLGHEPEVRSLRGAREAVERQILVDALTRAVGNISHAARAVGVTRPTFHSLLAKHGIQAQTFRRETSRGDG
ncbi:MAG: PEP-CTERM-box response regulator transcription factor [Candidatus Rokuibacteriota bacterium]